MIAIQTRTRALASALVLALGLAVAGAASADLKGVVNVNTASSDELQLLPGIGESRAHAILEERKRKGGFQSVDDLVAVKGIGDAALARLRPHVTLKGKTTAHVE
jgi:competence protein ComEA